MIDQFLFWLSLIFVFSIPWEDMISLPMIGSFSRLVGIILFGSWILKIIITGHLRKPHFFHVILYFFVMWNLASIFWTYGFEETKNRIITYGQILIFTMLVWDIYRASTELIAGLQFYIFGAWVGVISVFINFYLGKNIDAYEVGRFSASGVNAGDFVVILALGFPIAWYLARIAKSNSKSRILNIINYAYIPAAGLAIFLTGSRLALFVLAPALLYIFITLIQPKRILISLFILMIITLALFRLLTLVPQATWDRISTTKASLLQGDLGGRLPLWKESLATFSLHPILGVGGGAFRVVNPYRTAAHNTYLSVLAELGIIGFVFFISILMIGFYSVLLHPKQELLLWLTTFLILLIGISVQTWEFTKTTFLILSLILISASLYEYRLVYDPETNRPKVQKILAGT
jgi:O-antigen ligase